MVALPVTLGRGGGCRDFPISHPTYLDDERRITQFLPSRRPRPWRGRLSSGYPCVHSCPEASRQPICRLSQTALWLDVCLTTVQSKRHWLWCQLLHCLCLTHRPFKYTRLHARLKKDIGRTGSVENAFSSVHQLETRT